MPNSIIAIFNLIRLNSPTGYLLVFFPSVFGLLLDASSLRDILTIPLLFIGSITARGAGCVINDIIDRNFDAKVERTKNRPIANKSITVKEALIVLYALLLISLMILLSLNMLAVIIGFITFLMILTYPTLKRFTYFPQVFLGLTFNLGVLIAYASVTEDVTLKSMLLFLACCFWTIGYDTIYAFMDLRDDKKIGIKSLAVLLENYNYKFWILSCYAMFLLLFFIANIEHNHLIVISGILLVTPILLWQVLTVKIYERRNCSKRFKANNIVGGILALTMLVDFIVRL